MAHFKHTITLLLAFSIFISCGKNDQNEEEEEKPKQNNTEQKSTTINKNEDGTFRTPEDSIRSVKESVLRKQNYKKKEGGSIVDNQTQQTNKTPSTTAPKKSTIVPSFVYIKKILDECEIGVLMTQEDLEKKYNIPPDAMKLVKSITKTAPDELDIKWKSTWMIEKISDAKFTDGKMKMKFVKNKMYTSGSAIGIKYEKKLYTDLILIGRSAYIPSVKGYHWQIGKD